EAAGDLGAGQGGAVEGGIGRDRFRTIEHEAAESGQHENDHQADADELLADEGPDDAIEPLRAQERRAADEPTRDQARRQRPPRASMLPPPGSFTSSGSAAGRSSSRSSPETGISPMSTCSPRPRGM